MSKKYKGKKYQKIKKYILSNKPDIDLKELDELWIKFSKEKSYKKYQEPKVISVVKNKQPIAKVGGEYKVLERK